MNKPTFLALSILCLSLLLAGCSGNKKPDADGADVFGERLLYERAKSAMNNGRFEVAISYFQSLEARFPFSPYTLQAQLDLAYAYYKYGQPEKALSQADRFIRLNPTHEHVDYAYYLKGLANFIEEPSFLTSIFPRSPADLDQAPMQESYKEFSQLLRKYPQSRYAPDARQRLIYLRNKLAQHELGVVRFYMNKKAYIAAANRAKYILENFNETPANIEALALMLQAYRKLEMPDLAHNVERILTLNAPQHPLLNKK